LRILVALVCGALIVWSTSTPTRAVTVTSGEAVIVNLGVLPPSTTFAPVQFFLAFGPSDVLSPGEHFTTKLFNSSNSLLFTQGPYSVGSNSGGFGSAINVPVDNGGYFVFDQFVGSVDLVSAFVQGFVAAVGTGFTPASFEVIPETPLPAALPLFAGGLGLIGLLARRRKRAAT